MERFKIISLIIALLATQFSYAGHYHSMDEQHPETVCFLCIHASFLDNAIPADYLINIGVSLPDSPTAIDKRGISFTQYNVFNSRAPPYPYFS